MLRGFATVNFFADDVIAARDWYAGLFGTDPTSSALTTRTRPMSNSVSATTRTNSASSTAGTHRTATSPPAAQSSIGMSTIWRRR